MKALQGNDRKVMSNPKLVRRLGFPNPWDLLSDS